MNAIRGFTGEHRWLSNFWACLITSKTGLTFGSAEAAYQAAKCAAREQMAEFSGMTAGESKRAGRRVKIRPDWDTVKETVMLAVLRQKFGPANPDLREKLLATAGAHLEEANTWGDRYWGTVGGVGKNRLGILLMQVRQEIRGEVITTEVN